MNAILGGKCVLHSVIYHFLRELIWINARPRCFIWKRWNKKQGIPQLRRYAKQRVPYTVEIRGSSPISIMWVWFYRKPACGTNFLRWRWRQYKQDDSQRIDGIKSHNLLENNRLLVDSKTTGRIGSICFGRTRARLANQWGDSREVINRYSERESCCFALASASSRSLALRKERLLRTRLSCYWWWGV